MERSALGGFRQSRQLWLSPKLRLSGSLLVLLVFLFRNRLNRLAIICRFVGHIVCVAEFCQLFESRLGMATRSENNFCVTLWT